MTNMDTKIIPLFRAAQCKLNDTNSDSVIISVGLAGWITGGGSGTGTRYTNWNGIGTG